MSDPIKSKNHIGWSDDHQFEFVLISDQLYKCGIDANFDTEGNRVGSWECTKTMGMQHPDVYPFLQPVETSTWQDQVYNAPVQLKGQPTMFKSPTTGTFVSIE